jgi:hypothetical protein
VVMLKDYHEFSGRHPETGTIRNALAYQGVKAPHTGEPLSEALLLGVSGGVTVGYFTFEYEGYPPHIALLTRNTFSPLDTLFERLAIPRDVLQTSDAGKAESNLCSVLEAGLPALVLVDMFSLSYNNLPYDARNWGAVPVLVYGYEQDKAYLADRANVPIIIPTSELQAARGRIKKDKFRVTSLDAPDLSRLAAAVTKGIWQCINLYTEAPPKGKRDNFGLAALRYWIAMLTNRHNKHSWWRYFPPGERLWMALAGNNIQPGAFTWIKQEPGNHAERGMYADFLNEAAVILEKPALNEAADLFRESEVEWGSLCEVLLPSNITLMKETSELLTRKQIAFREQGADALPEIKAITARLEELRKEATRHFPLTESEIITFFESLSRQVLGIQLVEHEAVLCLQAAMA